MPLPSANDTDADLTAAREDVNASSISYCARDSTSSPPLSAIMRRRTSPAASLRSLRDGAASPLL
jgi:hypothetical protein